MYMYFIVRGLQWLPHYIFFSLTLSLHGDGKELSPSLPQQKSLQEGDTVTEVEAVQALLIVEP